MHLMNPHLEEETNAVLNFKACPEEIIFGVE